MPAQPLVTSRVAAIAGLTSAAVLVVGTLKRAGLVPAVPFVQLIAPLAQVLALFLLIGLFSAVPRRGRVLPVVAAASIASLALVIGVEFILNLVFPYLPAAQIAELRAGPLGAALTAVSLLFLVTAVATAVVVGRDSAAPRLFLAIYAVGAGLQALRAFLPAPALVVGLALLTIGVAGLSFWLLRSGRPGSPGSEVVRPD